MDSLTHFDKLNSADQSLVQKCVGAGGAFLHASSNGSDEKSLGKLQPSFVSAFAQDNFLVWIPDGCPSGKSTTVASSRIGKKLDEHSDWFDTLRTLGVQLSDTNHFLITSESTTTDRFVRRISELFQIPLVVFKPFPKRVTEAWCAAQVENSGSENPGSEKPDFKTNSKLTYDAWYKPIALESAKSAADSNQLHNINDLLIGIAQSAFLLSVRNSGNVFKAAKHRLENKTNEASTTKLLINKSLTPAKVEKSLLEKGAAAWLLLGENCDSETKTENPQPSSVLPTKPSQHSQPNFTHQFEPSSSPEAKILSIDEIKTDQFLLHWTRRRNGPWPDQSSDQFLDDLIFQSSRSNHNQIASLCRILATRTILGSSDITRDRRQVVCFSNVGVDQLPQKRTFRSHLSRWDFELYGIAIDKELLIELGAKPVIYGSDSVWDELTDADRPWFQVEKSQSGTVDWQSEKEWRILGDLKLDQIPLDQAFLFVPREADAAVAAKLSHWPIVILK